MSICRVHQILFIISGILEEFSSVLSILISHVLHECFVNCELMLIAEIIYRRVYGRHARRWRMVLRSAKKIGGLCQVWPWRSAAFRTIQFWFWWYWCMRIGNVGIIEVWIRMIWEFWLLTFWKWLDLRKLYRRRTLPIGREVVPCWCIRNTFHRLFVVAVPFWGGKCSIYRTKSLHIQIGRRRGLKVWGIIRVVVENIF